MAEVDETSFVLRFTMLRPIEVARGLMHVHGGEMYFYVYMI